MLTCGGDKLLIAPEKTADGKLDAYVGKAIKAGIRPEDIKDDEEFMEKHPSDATITAHVEVSELMGAEIYLYLDLPGPEPDGPRGSRLQVAATAATVVVGLRHHTRCTCSTPRPS